MGGKSGWEEVKWSVGNLLPGSRVEDTGRDPSESF